MKVLRYCILAVAVLAAAAAGLMSCKHGATLSSIAISPSAPIVAYGTTQQLSVTATFSDGLTMTWTMLEWDSSNTTVATIDANGLVTSATLGATTITATDVANNISSSATLTVDIPVSLVVYPADPGMELGTTAQMSATAMFSDGTSSQNVTSFMTWTTSDTTVATIDTTGLVTASSTTTGTTVVTATDATNNITGSTTLTVNSSALSSLTLDPADPSIANGTTQQFTATGTYADGTTKDITSSMVWSSSDTTIATIDYYSGLAATVAAGATTITATDPVTGVSGTTTLTVD